MAPVELKFGKDHINQSLRQIDSSSWLVAGFILRRLPHPSAKAAWNDIGDDSSYSFAPAPTGCDFPTKQTDNDPYVKLVYEAGDFSAVWSIGTNAFCKVKYIEEGTTPEAVTLDFVQKQMPSFKTPKILHYIVGKDRSYLFLERLPGRTLAEAWPSLSTERRLFYVNAVVRICMEMAEWEGEKLCGVDQQHVPEYYLRPRGVDHFGSLHDTCVTIGMDCSKYVFYHADLGPTNIIVEEDCLESGTVGIIDFEIAGYFPRGWIRTKFRVSSGMDLPESAEENAPGWWRKQVQLALGAKGLQEHADAYMEWMMRGTTSKQS